MSVVSKIPSRGIDAKLLVTTSNHILVNLADFEGVDEPDYDVWTSKRGRDSEETGTESDMTDGTEETITDPEEVPAKRSRRGVPRKPRVPRKKPPPACIQLSPALQSELRKLQQLQKDHRHPAAEWAKVSRAADKALALLLLDKGPRSMDISTVYNCQDIGFECELGKEQSGATQWIHAKTGGVRFERVLNIVDAASEMHIAIQNLIVRRWDRWKTMTGICDKWENFRQCHSCVWHHPQSERC